MSALTSTSGSNEALVAPLKERSVAWFFAEFWPIFIFVFCFVMMFSLPLIIAGAMPLQGLLIPMAFIMGLLLAFTLPRLLGLYILGLMVAIFVFQPHAIVKAPAIAAFFGSYALCGTLMLSFPPLKKPFKG
jgi:hypothetical protein